ncbi:Protein disulfide-isomerase [Phytophthora ramorum]|uniref:Protein disulfide-isomerase n=1 Tax=Phytophthora ramorum TaxID=164328 RepID=UPI003098C6DD|nr:Protein disulfide-isomerase [Phytophthora ramorum]
MMFIKQAARALALLFAVALVVRAAEFEEEDDVLVLTESNFAEAVSGHDTLLVEFYAPWCGHCKKLTPEYAAAAKNLKELDPPIRLAKVDATAESKLAEQFAVRGFPTLKFFKGDVEAVKDYDGGRTSAEIEKWVVKKSGPAVKIVETADELTAIKETNDVVVFAVVDAEEGETRALLEKLADADDLAVYVASTSTDVTEDAAAINKVVLYKKFDEGKVVYDGALEKEALGEFVKANSLPLVITFSQDKAPMIFGGETTEHLLAFVDTTKDYVSGIEAALKAPAQANKGKLLHVIMPSTEKRIVDYFGLQEEDFPAVMLVNMAGAMKKYGFDYKADDFVAKIEDGLSADLLAFENSYFEGKLTPQLKSADPEDDSEEAVKVIVGTQFQERVVDNEKDVLLEFYAPWCGHCKSLAPKYEELAEKFADVDSVMIAKMDATANEIDHAGVDVRGFPTLIFFPAKDKQNPVVYEGARDVDGFTEFLKANAQKFELEGSEHGAEEASEEDEEEQEEDEEKEDAKKEGAEHEEL